MFIIKKIWEKWSNWKSPNKHYWVANILTGVLAFGTFLMAFSTQRNIGIQKQQFAYTNRANIGYGNLITGDSVREARIFLANVGNLPANDFKLIWEIFGVNSESKPSPNKEHIIEADKIYPDQGIEVRCKSTAFKETNPGVILVVEYRYRCSDLKYIRKKGFHAIWVVPAKGGQWVTPAPRINPRDMDIIIETRERLRQFLEKEN